MIPKAKGLFHVFQSLKVPKFVIKSGRVDEVLFNMIFCDVLSKKWKSGLKVIQMDSECSQSEKNPSKPDRRVIKKLKNQGKSR